MAAPNYTQKGGVGVIAFQWLGPTLNINTLPQFAKSLALHTPGDGSLHVPTRNGVLRANRTDWVVLGADTMIDIIPNSHFTLLYQ